MACPPPAVPLYRLSPGHPNVEGGETALLYGGVLDRVGDTVGPGPLHVCWEVRVPGLPSTGLTASHCGSSCRAQGGQRQATARALGRCSGKCSRARPALLRNAKYYR